MKLTFLPFKVYPKWLYLIFKRYFKYLAVSLFTLLHFAEVNSQSFSTGEFHSVAVTNTGRVYKWGSRMGTMTYEADNRPIDITNEGSIAGKRVIAVSAGWQLILFLTEDSTVHSLGDSYGMAYNDEPYEDTIPTNVQGLENIIAINGRYPYALASDGTVYTWGNGSKEPPKIVSKDGYNYFDTFGKESKITSTTINGLDSVIAISAAAYHCLALRSNGTVWAWGNNNEGQLGNGSVEDSPTPVKVLGLDSIIKIAAGYNSSLALKSDGSVYTWGSGSSGQLADGWVQVDDNYEHWSPVPIKALALKDIIEISSVSFHCLAMDKDGKLYGWGDNFFGQLGCEDRIEYRESIPKAVYGVDLIYKIDSKIGSISWDKWNNVQPGVTSEEIIATRTANQHSDLNYFESPPNTGNNYYSRISGFIEPPQTGEYIFYLSSDDNSSLWLSTNDNPQNKNRISYVNSSTNKREWNRFASQKSLPIRLVAGNKYYIETNHFEKLGYDHLSVAWQLPDGSFEGPIPGSRLATFFPSENILPKVAILEPTNGAQINFNAPFKISVSASDVYGNIEKVAFFAEDRKLGEDFIPPYELIADFNIFDDALGVITVKAIDNESGISISSVIVVQNDSQNCNSNGSIEWEQWTNLPYGNIFSVPIFSSPNKIQNLNSFQSPSNIGNNYGARVRGFICPPQTGFYTFYISSDDYSELYLSSDVNPDNKTKIAYLNGYTAPDNWTKYLTQKSQTIYLLYGETYYIEAIHKENSGYDHLAVAWEMPDGTFEAPINGKYLSPYIYQTSKIARMDEYRSFWHEVTDNNVLQCFPNPYSTNASIHFTCNSSGPASIEIYDLHGNLISKIFEGKAEEGVNYQFEVSQLNLTPGIYICRLIQLGKIANLKLIKM